MTLAYLFGLGAYPLLDPDEPIYAEVGKEMLASRDVLTPTLEGRPWFDKPPGFYWLTAASMACFGVNEFGARFGSALAGLLAALVVVRIGRDAHSLSAGLWGGLAFAASLLVHAVSRAAVTDMLLVLFLALALERLLRACEAGVDPARDLSIFFAWAGLATLTKGPVGLLFPVATLLASAVVLGNARLVLGALSVRVFGWYFLVTLPWAVLVSLVNGDLFVHTFLGYHNLLRFVVPEHLETNRYWYYVPVLVAGFFPATALLPAAAAELGAAWRGDGGQGWRERLRGTPGRRRAAVLALFGCIVFAFFTMSKTKLATYVLPVFVPLSVGVGAYLAIERRIPGPVVRWLGGMLFLVVGSLPALAAQFGVDQRFGMDKGEAFLPAVVLALGTVVGACFQIAGRPRPALAAAAAGSLLFFPLATVEALPRVATGESVASLAHEATARARPGERLGAAAARIPSLVFYADRPVSPLRSEKRVVAFLSGPDRVFVVIRREDLVKAVASTGGRLPAKVLASAGEHVLASNRGDPR